ncbi:MAG: hypothetical protein KC766_07540 [Myxococcales bacterium]|nr:hypothetical protein [Myxococcales bacterium]
MSERPGLARERLVLWVGSASEMAEDVAFPHGIDERDTLRYVNSAGAPHPQPEKQRLPQQPMLLVVWFPPRDLESGTLVQALCERFTLGLGERRVVTHCLAAYEPTGNLSHTNAPGDYAGLMVGLTDCVDPSALEAFQTWYDQVHAAEALAPGIFSTGHRYRRLGPGVPRRLPAEPATPHALAAPEFLALYESERPGTEAVAELVKPENRPPSALHPSCRIRGFWAFDRS